MEWHSDLTVPIINRKAHVGVPLTLLFLGNPAKGLDPETDDTTHKCEVMGTHTWEERYTQLTHAR